MGRGLNLVTSFTGLKRLVMLKKGKCLSQELIYDLGTLLTNGVILSTTSNAKYYTPYSTSVILGFFSFLFLLRLIQERMGTVILA
jgi:hypothetical protein